MSISVVLILIVGKWRKAVYGFLKEATADTKVYYLFVPLFGFCMNSLSNL